MGFLTATVAIRLGRLRQFASTLESDLRLRTNGSIRQALSDWRGIYARFITKRYESFSHGAGTWALLAPVTLARKLSAGLLPFILRRTDVSFRSLAPEMAAKPGYLSQEVPFGMRIRFGGEMDKPHPSSPGKTISQILWYHQLGEGNLPQRKILVPPDQDTINRMRDRAKQGLEELADKHNASETVA